MKNDYKIYKHVIDQQRQSVAMVQRNVHITTAIVFGIILVMIVVGCFVKEVAHWGLLVSIIGSIGVLFNSLARISRTIRTVQIAFPNEGFVWVNVWNLVAFAVLLLLTYSMSLVCGIYGMDGIDSMTEA